MGKEKINRILNERLARGEKLFVPYIMAGDGGLDVLEDRIQFLTDCGVSAIELGIPFSDPTADGPTIQSAGVRALTNGTTLASVLDRLKSFKHKRTIPIILMTYINPVLYYGIENFVEKCVVAGVDGVIIPDVPLEEEELIAGILQENNVAFIRLVAITSPIERVQLIASRTEGFLYAVSVMGTTGVRNHHDEQVKDYLQMLKGVSTVPVLAGFGVSTINQAQELGTYCDGVVVGSKIVDLFNNGKREEIRELIQGSVLKKRSHV
ncbi:tryptophan synthase subunit alpha [Bacillus andreraoultii]|uniref:tryptophan synthase subunit alpha n=1 Tax=Bacillus andreraoultii TaxID=1499685 RepID=UPI000539B1A0|nr:tryptophan synthase subunit alpha [Bacillus andreraoultii]